MEFTGRLKIKQVANSLIVRGSYCVEEATEQLSESRIKGITQISESLSINRVNNEGDSKSYSLSIRLIGLKARPTLRRKFEL